MKKHKIGLFLTAIIVFSAVVVGLFINIPIGRVDALSGNEFQAGRIIDDDVFFDSGSMSPNEIQAFLNSKVPVCDTWHTSSNPSYQPPFTCLKDYVQTTVGKSAESGLCNGYGVANQSAAQIIHGVAQSCGINPKALIVLLQKEQSLVTDDWPWSIQYRSATGYGCPDTAPCDAQYYGFFNQVYAAARQFKNYAKNPANYNYRHNRSNFILYNPNTSCGGGNVFVQNQATAGLYNYTPYQPNIAALNNLYGTGDGCSAYGNRNFWRIYNDWFGSTYGSYLLRSVENSTVYLVVDNMKYPISNMDTMNALYPLGPVKFVSQNFLNQKSTGITVGKLIRSSNGTIYFFDAGIKLAFLSCEMIEHYGFGAGCNANYINLPDIIMQKITTGPNMTRVFGTTSGKSFYIDSGNKREIYDNLAKQEAGINAAQNVLNESAIGNLTYGSPIIRNNTIIRSRGSQLLYLQQQNLTNPLPSSLYNETALSKSLTIKLLDDQSVAKLPKSTVLTGFISNNSGTQKYVLDSIGKALLNQPQVWSQTHIPLDDTLLGLLSNSNQPVNNELIKSPSNGTVYLVESGKKRPIYDWDDLLRMKFNPLSINSLSSVTISAIPDGPRLLGPGRLVKSNTSSTVYLIDGTVNKFAVTTFNVPINLGTGLNLATVPESLLDEYSTKPSNLGVKVQCSGKNYLASGGKLYEISVSVQSHYNLTYTQLDDLTCSNSPKSSQTLGRFLLEPTGTIYFIENGTKRPFKSFTTYSNYGGNASNTTLITTFSLLSIPTASPI